MVVHEEKGIDVVSWTLTIKKLRSRGKDDRLKIFVLIGSRLMVFEHFPSLTLVPDFQLLTIKTTITFVWKSSNESGLLLASHFSWDPYVHIIYIILTLGNFYCIKVSVKRH